jgi:hypothetical protein
MVVIMKTEKIGLWRVCLWEKGSDWKCSVNVLAVSTKKARDLAVNIMSERGDILSVNGKKEIRKTSIELIDSGYGVVSNG